MFQSLLRWLHPGYAVHPGYAGWGSVEPGEVGGCNGPAGMPALPGSIEPSEIGCRARPVPDLQDHWEEPGLRFASSAPSRLHRLRQCTPRAIALLYRLWNFPSLDKEGWRVAPGWFETGVDSTNQIGVLYSV